MTLKFPKLTKKQKIANKRYDRIVKLSAELLELRFDKVKNVKCARCNKKVLVSDCIGCQKKNNKIFSKMKNVLHHESSLPFGLIPKIFNSATPFVVCNSCKDAIYRFMGKIPDIVSSGTFPQHIVSLDTQRDLFKSIKKSDAKIHYKKKIYPYTKVKLEVLRKEAVTSYLKKYPYVNFTALQLLAILKSSKKLDRVEVWH